MQFSLKRMIKAFAYGVLLVTGFVTALFLSRHGGGHQVTDGFGAPIAYADVPYTGDAGDGDAGDGDGDGDGSDGDGCGGSDGDDGGK